MGIETAILGALLAATSGAAVGGQIFQAVKAKKSRKQNLQTLNTTQAQQQNLIEEAKGREEKEEDLEENALTQKAQREAQRKKRAETSGRRGTILTSPLGLVGQGTSAKKTLLGQ